MSFLTFSLASVAILLSTLSLAADVVESGVHSMLGAVEGVEVALFELAIAMLSGGA